MKKIVVEVLAKFVVESVNDLTEKEAKWAAESAVYHHLGLIDQCGRPTDKVKTHVDGFGKCAVSISED